MSLLSPLITLFDIGMMGMADALVETVASSSPANPINSAVFDMTILPAIRFHPSIPKQRVTPRVGSMVAMTLIADLSCAIWYPSPSVQPVRRV
jgi:hypothetical protein